MEQLEIFFKYLGIATTVFGFFYGVWYLWFVKNDRWRARNAGALISVAIMSYLGFSGTMNYEKNQLLLSNYKNELTQKQQANNLLEIQKKEYEHQAQLLQIRLDSAINRYKEIEKEIHGNNISFLNLLKE